MIVKDLQKSIDIIVKINDVIMGGQTDADLSISKSTIDITNQIKSEWEESLPGLRAWSVVCNGLYIKNERCFALLQESFMNNEDINVSVFMDGKEYTGSAIIVDYPIKAVYNETYKYRIRLVGNGELKIVE